MWQSLGTLAISAFGGAFLVHYLNNFLLEEKAKFSFDWDGVVERALITYLIASRQNIFLIPLIIVLKAGGRLLWLARFGGLFKADEPGVVSQKVLFKAELALELLVSPAFAILIGIVF